MENKLYDYLNRIQELDTSKAEEMQKKMDGLTKPKNSLGRLEELAIQVCLIRGEQNPPLKNRQVFVMAGDSGVVKEGVSAYPQEVTPQMIYNFLNGGAAINAIGRTTGFNVNVIDVGIVGEIETDHPYFYNMKVGNGTKNFRVERAMTVEQAMESIVAGIEIVLKKNEEEPLDVIATGDMGIGNTTPSSAIVSAITGIPPKNVTGYGTGIDNEGFARKVKVIKESLDLHKPDPDDALDVLSKVGSFEIGAIAGTILGASILKIPVIVDGFISQAGALIACTLKPESVGYIIPSHQSFERGSSAVWRHLGLRPYLYLDMRLGEGTGALLMMNLIESSLSVFNEMATFEGAGVSNKI
ncbi:MAG TPA: nicotinate-nucleotide--dimethylbenzimidazole phosphoribosyltransferase [Candidatus Methanofastidiosa archaeon]|nr:nicotinate-nucleotide--dimethylbenzimidazole phosphoribosyltransferase [Candidatus Methanofastidiosa archaeon]